MELTGRRCYTLVLNHETLCEGPIFGLTSLPVNDDATRPLRLLPGQVPSYLFRILVPNLILDARTSGRTEIQTVELAVRDTAPTILDCVRHADDRETPSTWGRTGLFVKLLLGKPFKEADTFVASRILMRITYRASSERGVLGAERATFGIYEHGPMEMMRESVRRLARGLMWASTLPTEDQDESFLAMMSDGGEMIVDSPLTGTTLRRRIRFQDLMVLRVLRCDLGPGNQRFEGIVADLLLDSMQSGRAERRQIVIRRPRQEDIWAARYLEGERYPRENLSPKVTMMTDLPSEPPRMPGMRLEILRYAHNQEEDLSEIGMESDAAFGQVTFILTVEAAAAPLEWNWRTGLEATSEVPHSVVGEHRVSCYFCKSGDHHASNCPQLSRARDQARLRTWMLHDEEDSPTVSFSVIPAQAGSSSASPRETVPHSSAAPESVPLEPSSWDEYLTSVSDSESEGFVLEVQAPNLAPATWRATQDQRNVVLNVTASECFFCGSQGHLMSDCPDRGEVPRLAEQEEVSLSPEWRCVDCGSDRHTRCLDVPRTDAALSSYIASRRTMAQPRTAPRPEMGMQLDQRPEVAQPPPCYECSSISHQRPECPGKPQSSKPVTYPAQDVRVTRDAGRQPTRCTRCFNPGHRAYDCPSRKEAIADTICLGCGNTDHSVLRCPVARGVAELRRAAGEDFDLEQMLARCSTPATPSAPRIPCLMCSGPGPVCAVCEATPEEREGVPCVQCGEVHDVPDHVAVRQLPPPTPVRNQLVGEPYFQYDTLPRRATRSSASTPLPDLVRDAHSQSVIDRLEDVAPQTWEEPAVPAWDAEAQYVSRYRGESEIAPGWEDAFNDVIAPRPVEVRSWEVPYGPRNAPPSQSTSRSESRPVPSRARTPVGMDQPGPSSAPVRRFVPVSPAASNSTDEGAGAKREKKWPTRQEQRAYNLAHGRPPPYRKPRAKTASQKRRRRAENEQNSLNATFVFDAAERFDHPYPDVAVDAPEFAEIMRPATDPERANVAVITSAPSPWIAPHLRQPNTDHFRDLHPTRPMTVSVTERSAEPPRLSPMETEQRIVALLAETDPWLVAGRPLQVRVYEDSESEVGSQHGPEVRPFVTVEVPVEWDSSHLEPEPVETRTETQPMVNGVRVMGWGRGRGWYPGRAFDTRPVTEVGRVRPTLAIPTIPESLVPAGTLPLTSFAETIPRPNPFAVLDPAWRTRDLLTPAAEAQRNRETQGIFWTAQAPSRDSGDESSTSLD